MVERSLLLTTYIGLDPVYENFFIHWTKKHVYESVNYFCVQMKTWKLNYLSKILINKNKFWNLLFHRVKSRPEADLTAEGGKFWKLNWENANWELTLTKNKNTRKIFEEGESEAKKGFILVMSYFATLHYNSICTLNIALEIWNFWRIWKAIIEFIQCKQKYIGVCRTSVQTSIMFRHWCYFFP